MSKSTRWIILIVIIFGIVGIWYLSQPKIDTTGRVHTELYEGAKNVFDPQIQIIPFRAQEILGEQVGWSSYLQIEWEPPAKEYNHFLITITDPATSWTRTEAGEHDRLSLDLSGLNPATEYVIALQACLESECERWYIAQQETFATTAKQYWQIDNESFEPRDTDTILEDAILNSTASVILENDGSLSDRTDFDEMNIYFENGAAWTQRVISSIEIYPKPSATLLNP